MLMVSILLFTIAAFLGIYLLTFVLQNKNTPKGVTFTHGPMAVLGLILLIIYALVSQPAPIMSIIIFVLAAMGGFFLVFKDLTGQPIPKWLALGHGIVAAIGYAFLIFFAFNQ